MTYDTPYYTLRYAFEPRPLVMCFGWGGLLNTLPLLEPAMYFVAEEGRQVGMIECRPDGRHWIRMQEDTVADEIDFIA